MADKLIKNLTGLTLPDADADDVLPIYDITADDTKKIRVDQIGSVSHVYQKVLDNGYNVATADTAIEDADTSVFNDSTAFGVAKKISFSAWVTSTFQRIFNKVTSLSSAGALSGSDELVLSQSGVAKKVAYSAVKTDIQSGVFDSIDDISTSLTSLAGDDYLPISDTSAAGVGKKTRLKDIFGNGWTTITDLVTGSPFFVVYNSTGGAVNKVVFTSVVNNVFGKLPQTTETSVDTADYVGFSDTSAGTGKKISFANFVKSIFGNITNQTSKATPVGADEIIIADSASSGVAKKTTLTQLAATSLFTSASLNAIHSQTEKATVVDADEFVINDSAASWVVKKATFTTLLTWILTKYQDIFNKGNDLPAYPSMSIDYDYLIGVESDTGTAVKIFPKDVIRSIVSSTTTNITISGAFGYNPGLLLVDANSGNKTISLPAATTHKYIQWSVKKIDSSANTVTIDPNASETIDGAATYVLSSQYSTVTFISDGSAWYII